MSYSEAKRERAEGRMATCHPDRRHRARGLCRKCYSLWRFTQGYEAPAREADCHPDRRAKARGLCDACYQAEWRKAHPRTPEQRRRYQAAFVAKNPGAMRIIHLRRHFNLTVEEYGAMLDAQGNACALCFAKPDRHLDVDHDHNTGAVRGLLCQRCNKGIGLLGEDPEVLARAIAYLGVGGVIAKEV